MAARGRRWTWRLWRATCRQASRRVPSPKTVGGQAAVFQLVAALKRGQLHVVGEKQQLLTPELLDEIREIVEEEHGRISVKIVSKRFTSSRTCSRKGHPFVALVSVGDPYRAPSGGPPHP